ncbi:Oxysterol-binding protein-domain-containing protein [Protomyces lactucae-debilis]|uniref:Oxysterol-binding protein-domain-containing protein n=1 Tax=Protomyces lactucae-debilis TaxID=2754530 RepID=A0A1Y2F853_PROLT|nr:Oxysterol-binding protein-domain-containing protein [Protomyces lactucae-debilis]ORY80039.1 Oxysterol-binding protein-domain-containing protein [Protomyces lactucae-debilis]
MSLSRKLSHARTPSLAEVSTKTQVYSETVGVNESIKSYRFLEALRVGDLQEIDKHFDESAIPPTILAVQCADAKTFSYVLNKDEDVNARDAHGNTALHHAVQLGRSEIVDILMDHPEINDTVQNDERKQAFELAGNAELAHKMQAKRGDYIEKINQHFAQALKTKDASLTDLLDNPRAASLLDLNKQDADGNTAIHHAAHNRDASLVSLLLNHGADPFPRNRKGKLPTDLCKDDRIKALFKNVPQKTMLNASPSDPIRYAGHLKKWTNYKSGYKARWFVLESGVLSYYRSKDESETACRGSINMKAARINYAQGDKTKFEVLGPDKNGFHVKAAHPTEAKNWIWNLNQAKMQARDKGKQPSTSKDLTGAPIAISAAPSVLDMPNSYAPSIGSVDEHFSDNESEVDSVLDIGDEPHKDFGLTANAAKVQLELMDQICAQMPDASETTSAFRSSAASLREILTQLVKMSGEREKYWRASISHEREVRRLWEETMQTLATDQEDMERKVYEAKVKQKNTRKALKEVKSELDRVKADTPAGSPITDAPDPIAADVAPYLDSEDSSDDEFYDAVASGSTAALGASGISRAATMQSPEPIAERDEVAQQKPAAQTAPAQSESESRITKSFKGYENGIRTTMGRQDDRPSVSLWGILKSMIGKDMTKMTLPVSFNEATSLLQRVAEDMEYTDILDKAAKTSDPTERALYVGAFAASEYASTIDRVAKPFNPLLHETYEYCRPDKGFRFVVEQVSHHPPIGAAHAESDNWVYYGESSVKSRFTGKTFDINPLGTWYLHLRLPDGTEEVYSWRKVNTQVVGILLGSPTVDNYGPMVITNHTTGEQCKLEFKARGWRGAGAYKVDGVVLDRSGEEQWVVHGKWNEQLYARKANGGPADGNMVVWQTNPRPKGVPFNLTQFAMTLNALDNGLKSHLPPTDTRLRPDQRAMEDGQYDFAATEKNRLEEKQRARRREREKSGLEHGARWFKQAKHPVTGEEYWEFTGDYWQVREQAAQGQVSWDVEDIF